MGCSTRLPVGQPVTITFACPDYMADHYRPLAERFSEASGHTRVEVVSADAATGHGPGAAASDDVIKIARAADTFVYDASALDWQPPQGTVLDLTELAREDERLERNDVYPAALALVERDGHLWGLPAEVDVNVLYYRPSAFLAEGVPFPEIGWTREAWLDAALRLTVRDGERVERYAFTDPWPGFTLVALATQAAGPLIEGRDGVTEALIDQPAVAEVLSWYADLSRVHWVMPDPSKTDYVAAGQLIDVGKAAMWVDRGGMREQYALRTGGDVGLAPLPEAGPPAAWASGRAYLVSAGSAHAAEAWEWTVFLSRQAPFSHSRAIPSRRSVADDVGYWEHMGDDAEALVYSLDHGLTYPTAVWAGLQRALMATLEGESVDAALAAAQARLNESLADLARGAAGDSTPPPVATPAPTPGTQETVVRFAASPGSDLAVYRALAERFTQEHPDIAVEVVTGGGASLADLAAKADCFVAPAQSPRYERTDAVLALDPLVEATGFSIAPYVPALLDQARIDTALCGLPLEVDGALLYYQRALFDAAGRPYPTAGWITDDFVDAALALTDHAATPPTYGYWPRDGAYARLVDYLTWLGADLFDAEGRPTYDGPAVVEALSRYALLVEEAMPREALERRPVRGGPVVTTSGLHPGPTADGRVAMWLDDVSNHRRAPALSFDAGVAPLPAGGAAPATLVVEALFVGRRASDPEACWAWITYLSASPEAVGTLPARMDIVESAAWRAGVGEETACAWAETLPHLEGAAATGMQALEANGLILTWLDGALEDVLAGDDPSTALARAQERATTYHDCVRAAGDAIPSTVWRECARQADPNVMLPAE